MLTFKNKQSNIGYIDLTILCAKD